MFRQISFLSALTSVPGVHSGPKKFSANRQIWVETPTVELLVDPIKKYF